MRYKAAVFDMDGTLLDTIEDMKNAMNYAFGKAQITGREFSEKEMKGFFGSGITVALHRAFQALGLPEDEAKIRQVEEIYRPYYDEHCSEHTKPYPGMGSLLRKLREKGILCAAVSNKPDNAVRQLCRVHFDGLFQYEQGENIAAGIRKKPAPDMTDAALRALQTPREKAVYIGDSEVDIQTANASHIPCISVLWGFREKEYLLRQGGSRFAETMDELYTLLTE